MMLNRQGWFCSRCSASNSPDVQKCACSPMMQPMPALTLYPWTSPWWPAPYEPNYPCTPYITWTTTSGFTDSDGLRIRYAVDAATRLYGASV